MPHLYLYTSSYNNNFLWVLLSTLLIMTGKSIQQRQEFKFIWHPSHLSQDSLRWRIKTLLYTIWAKIPCEDVSRLLSTPSQPWDDESRLLTTRGGSFEPSRCSYLIDNTLGKTTLLPSNLLKESTLLIRRKRRLEWLEKLSNYRLYIERLSTDLFARRRIES